MKFTRQSTSSLEMRTALAQFVVAHYHSSTISAATSDMGLVESVPDATAHEGPMVGFRVLDVSPGSPAAAAGLVHYFDFVIAANGVRLVRLGSCARQFL